MGIKIWLQKVEVLFTISEANSTVTDQQLICAGVACIYEKHDTAKAEQ